jgi:hypothetical protein
VSQFDRGVASYGPDDRSGEDAVRVLGAEVERLRAQVDDYRMMIDGLENAAHEERAAVVAWLRKVSERRFARNEREVGIVFRLAHEIERGEHRRDYPSVLVK